MIKHIIFIIEQPWSQRNYDRLGVELLQKNGFEIHVYNVTPYFYPAVAASVKVLDPVNFAGLIELPTRESIEQAVTKINPAYSFVFCLIGWTAKSLFLFEALQHSRIRYGIATSNATPTLPDPGLLAKIFQKVRNPGQWYGMIQTRLERLRINRKKHIHNTALAPDLWVAGGQKSLEGTAYPKSPQTQYLWVHAMDYDLYLQHLQTPPAGFQNAVLLDEYMPFHPDYTYLKVPPPAQPENYYSGLRKLFDYVEKTFKVQVIIAAHPRANYQQHPDYFAGRPVVSGKTIQLVKNASFILAHQSTSLAFAVLFRKPIIFLTSNELDQSWFGKYIHNFAQNFGKKPINVDQALEQLDWEQELTVQEEFYQLYQSSYIKKAGTPEMPFWQIVADYLKKQEADKVTPAKKLEN